VSPSATAAAGPKFKRSAKNYLLDSRFQLKYTGYLVGVTLVVAVALGCLLYWQTTKTVAIGNEAVEVGAEASKAGKAAVQQSDSLNTALEMSAMDKYPDDPVMIESMKADNKTQSDAIAARATELDASSAKLQKEHQALETQQRTLMIILAAGLLAFVVAIGLGGIVVTHKIAGPIFKMKRLLREVGDGKLVVQSRLRKGDEMHDLFEVFATMVDRLRARQEDKIKILDAAIEQATAAGVDEATLAKIKNVRGAMQAEVEVKASTRPPGSLSAG
jgi:nitrogen fixation/metabolism regulation signal transduction histidine kinase